MVQSFITMVSKTKKISKANKRNKLKKRNLNGHESNVALKMS